MTLWTLPSTGYPVESFDRPIAQLRRRLIWRRRLSSALDICAGVLALFALLSLIVLGFTALG